MAPPLELVLDDELLEDGVVVGDDRLLDPLVDVFVEPESAVEVCAVEVGAEEVCAGVVDVFVVAADAVLWWVSAA